MDKFDFINWLISLYPHAIKDSKAQYDLYDRVLNKNKIDFNKLADIFSNEYADSFPPAGAVIKEMASRCLKEEAVQASKWVHVKIYNPHLKAVINTDCFPAGTSESAILNTYKKRFGGEGWQIMELNYA